MKIMVAEWNNVCKLGDFHVEYITFNLSYFAIITIICYSYNLYPPFVYQLLYLYYNLYCY